MPNITKRKLGNPNVRKFGTHGSNFTKKLIQNSDITSEIPIPDNYSYYYSAKACNESMLVEIPYLDAIDSSESCTASFVSVDTCGGPLISSASFSEDLNIDSNDLTLSSPVSENMTTTVSADLSNNFENNDISQEPSNHAFPYDSTNNSTDSTDSDGNSGTDKNIYWYDGRRIVELKVLAQGLSKCSGEDCDLRLDLRNILKETRSGYGSFLWIKCECGEETKVPTGKEHKINKHGRSIFDVNTKVVAATLHSGFGHESVARFMSVIEVPPPAISSSKAWERQIGPKIETITKNEPIFKNTLNFRIF